MAPKSQQNKLNMELMLTDVSPVLYARLCELSRRNGRSLNRQIIAILERELSPRPIDRNALLGRIRARRETMNIWVDDKSISQAIQHGRN